MKKLLCIISTPPFKGAKVIEQLESAMVAAVFEMEVSILFIDEGIHCLHADQKGHQLGARSPGNLIQGLQMYEIDHLYAGEEAAAICLPTDVVVLTTSEQAELLAKQDLVIQ